MKRLTGVAYAILSSATFGLVPLFSIPLMDRFDRPPLLILFYRLTLAALFAGLLARAQKQSFRMPLSTVFPLAGLGFLYMATVYLLLLSYRMIDSGLATTLHFMYPLGVLSIGLLFYAEKFSGKLLFSMLLSLVGVILLSAGPSAEGGWAGMLLAFLSSFTYAAYLVGIQRSRAKSLPPLVFNFYILVFGAVSFLVLLSFQPETFSLPGLPEWGLLAGVAFLSTIVSNFALVKAIRFSGSTLTAIMGSTEPLTAVAVGVLVFGESFNWLNFSGMLLVIFSVLFVAAPKRKANAEATATVRSSKA